MFFQNVILRQYEYDIYKNKNIIYPTMYFRNPSNTNLTFSNFNAALMLKIGN